MRRIIIRLFRKNATYALSLFLCFAFFASSFTSYGQESTPYQKTVKDINSENFLQLYPDVGKVLLDIRESFFRWNARGDFEDEAEWNVRLQEKSDSVFIKLCNRILEDFISDYNWDVFLGEYDSEKESFAFAFDHQGLWNLSLSVPLLQAETFRAYFSNSLRDYFQIPHESSNFLCVNHLIYPKKIIFEFEKGIYRQEIPLCVRENVNPAYEIDDVVIYFDDLSIDNPYLKGSYYNFTKQAFTSDESMIRFEREQEALQRKIQEEEEIKRVNDSVFQYVNQTLQVALSAYHQQLKNYPYDVASNEVNLSIPDFLYGDNPRLSDTLQSLLDSLLHRQGELQERYYADSICFVKYSDTLQQAVMKVNTALKEYPYNIFGRTLSDSLSMSNFGNISVLRQELQEKLNALPERQNAVQTRVYNELKENDPSRFVEIYFTQEPEKKVQADSMYIECRCTYIEPLLFQLDFINNKLPRCDCREKSFHEVGFLFKNREEFDGFYSMDEPSFKKEVSKRQALKKDLREFESALRNSKPVNLKKGLYSEKQEVKTVISRMAYHKQNCYYEEAVWILFMYNTGLYKEWEKNGRYFKNKIEMYEAYIGEEYSSILKAKKKE